LGTPGGESWNVLITDPPSWGFDVPLAMALCKNLSAENTQRWLSRPKPTRVAVPIEEEEDINSLESVPEYSLGVTAY